MQPEDISPNKASLTNQKLPEHMIAELVSVLGQRWQLERNPDRLVCEIRFSSFSEAFSFMTKVALLAEKHDHHPDWRNTYSLVVISLTTHDAGGLTEQDISFAKAVNQMLE